MDVREVDMSSISGLTRVVKVWYPYDSCAPESPPNRVRWDRWGSFLCISSVETPEAGEKLRVYYHQAQTIEGLDDASSTTVPLLSTGWCGTSWPTPPVWGQGWSHFCDPDIPLERRCSGPSLANRP